MESNYFALRCASLRARVKVTRAQRFANFILRLCVRNSEVKRDTSVHQPLVALSAQKNLFSFLFLFPQETTNAYRRLEIMLKVCRVYISKKKIQSAKQQCISVLLQKKTDDRRN